MARFFVPCTEKRLENLLIEEGKFVRDVSDQVLLCFLNNPRSGIEGRFGVVSLYFGMGGVGKINSESNYKKG